MALMWKEELRAGRGNWPIVVVGSFRSAAAHRSYRNFYVFRCSRLLRSLVKAYISDAGRVPIITASDKPSPSPHQEELRRYHRSFSDDSSRRHIGGVSTEGGLTV